MARQSVAKHKVQTMAQEKREHKSKHERMSRQPSGSPMSLSDRETRAKPKATIEDLEQLYSALQGLVPKQAQQLRRRATAGGTDRRKSEDFETPRIRNINNNRRNGNMSSIETILDIEANEKKNKRVSIDDRMFVSDSELNRRSSNESLHNLHKLNRHMSLPVYDDESANEMADGNATTEMADGNATEMADGDDGASTKRSKFSIFRRRRRPKTQKKKRSSWRNLLDTLSFKRRSTKNLKKKSKKDGTSSETLQQDGGALSHEELTTKRTVHTSHNILTCTPVINENTGQSSSKPKAPETLVEENRNDGFLENIMKTRSDEVNKKLKTWYKNVVKETKSLNSLAPRYSQSCESLLTDSEILRARGTYSTDTASSGGVNDIQSRVNLNKVRIRKSRAKRNRRKERARWQSLPNVKLVSCALNLANKKAERPKSIANDMIKEKETTEVPNNPKFPTNFKVKPVEAKISFGNTSEKDKTTESPINDFLRIQKGQSSRWLSRQCSKTTISCIRPLQLNLFYSESPSREAIFKCKKINCEKPKFQFKDAPDAKPETTEGIPNTVIVRQTSAPRRRKRRSFKRQSRLPHQSPFYLPPSNSAINSPSKFPFSLGKETRMEDEQTLSKDSGIGSPEYHKNNAFRLQPINTSERRRTPKLYSESEDSGWASMDKSRVDTKIQVDPTTAGSMDHGSFQLQSLNDSDGQSEA